MSEVPFRRVVILCDAACDIRAAVGDAATLAARWGVALQGIFLDDENLLRLAALPFGRQVSLSSATVGEALSVHRVAGISAALGAGMRRALAEAAGALGLEWTFSNVRDLAAASTVTAAGDIVVVEGAARAFSGQWRPLSALRQNAANVSGTILIRGRGNARKGIVLVPPSDREGSAAVLAAGAALATDDSEIVVVRAAAAAATDEREITKYFAEDRRGGLRILPIVEHGATVMRVIARLDPALVVLAIDGAAPTELADLLSKGQRDILLVRA